MTWTFSIVPAALFIALYFCGLWTGRRGRTAALVAMLICLPLLLLCVFLKRWPVAGYAVARLGPWGWLYPWWTGFTTYFVLGISSSPVMPRKPRIAVITLAACYFLMYFYQLFSLHCVDVAKMDNRAGRDGVCHQSTGWSCAPAAGVTLLAQLGIPATEGEMALLCRTIPELGTDEVMLALALREKARPQGYDFVFVTSNWPDLCARRLPAIAGVRLPVGIIHSTVILAVDADQVTQADPLRGKIRMTRQEFLAEWLKNLVAVAP